MKIVIQCLAIFFVSMAVSATDIAAGQMGSKLFGKPLATPSAKPFGQVDGSNFAIKEIGELGLPVRESGGFKLPSLGSFFGGSAAKPPAPLGLLDQFNAKSKSAIDRTTDWAREKQQKAFGGLKKTGNQVGMFRSVGDLFGVGVRNLFGGLKRESTEAAAPAVSRAVAGAEQITRPTSPNYYGAGAQPPIRAAANPNGQSTQRF